MRLVCPRTVASPFRNLSFRTSVLLLVVPPLGHGELSSFRPSRPQSSIFQELNQTNSRNRGGYADYCDINYSPCYNGKVTYPTATRGHRRDGFIPISFNLIRFLYLYFLVCVFLVPAVGQTAAQDGSHQRSSANQQRIDTLSALAREDISAQSWQKITPLITQGSLFQPLSTEVIRCDPRLYEFLLDHPDVTVSMWKAMGISRIEMVRVQDNIYQIRTPSGLQGVVEFLLRGPNSRIILFEGHFRDPLTGRKVPSQALLYLRCTYLLESDQQYYVVHHLDIFLKMASKRTSLFMKLLSPITLSQSKQNFLQISNFLTSLYTAAVERPDSMATLINRLERIQTQDRYQLHDTMKHLFDRKQKREKVGRAILSFPP